MGSPRDPGRVGDRQAPQDPPLRRRPLLPWGGAAPEP